MKLNYGPRERFAETINNSVPFSNYEHNENSSCDCPDCFTDRVMGRAGWPMDLMFAFIFLVNGISNIAAGIKSDGATAILFAAIGGVSIFFCGWAFADFRQSRKNMRKGCD